MVRVDHQLSAKTSIFGRYSFDNDNLIAPQLLPDQVQNLAGRRQYTTLQVNNILGPKVLNNFRFAFNRTHSISTQNTIPDPGPQFPFIPGQQVGTLNVGGLDTAGSRAITPFGPTNGQGAFVWAFNVFEWGDDFTYVTGKHAIKAGVDIQRIQDNTVQSNQVRGTYTFTTLNNFIVGNPQRLLRECMMNPPSQSKLLGLTTSSIVGVVDIVDYTKDSKSKWAQKGFWHLHLRNVRPLKPVDCSGQLGFWTPQFSVMKKLPVWVRNLRTN